MAPGSTPPVEEALEIAGLFTMAEYIERRRNTIAQHVATRPILDLCRAAQSPPGSPQRAWWWEQLE